MLDAEDVALYIVASCVMVILALVGVGMISTASYACTLFAVAAALVAVSIHVVPRDRGAASTVNERRTHVGPSMNASARVSRQEHVVEGGEDTAVPNRRKHDEPRPLAAKSVEAATPRLQLTYAGHGATQDVVDTNMVEYEEILKPHGLNRSVESWQRLRSAMFRTMGPAATNV